MDVVAAIDAWIDDRIDSLDDEQLEEVLEILDVVAASEFAGREAASITDDDFSEIIGLFTDDSRRATYAEDMIDEALDRASSDSSDSDSTGDLIAEEAFSPAELDELDADLDQLLAEQGDSLVGDVEDADRDDHDAVGDEGESSFAADVLGASALGVAGTGLVASGFDSDGALGAGIDGDEPVIVIGEADPIDEDLFATALGIEDDDEILETDVEIDEDLDAGPDDELVGDGESNDVLDAVEGIDEDLLDQDELDEIDSDLDQLIAAPPTRQELIWFDGDEDEADASTADTDVSGFDSPFFGETGEVFVDPDATVQFDEVIATTEHEALAPGFLGEPDVLAPRFLGSEDEPEVAKSALRPFAFAAALAAGFLLFVVGGWRLVSGLEIEPVQAAVDVATTAVPRADASGAEAATEPTAVATVAALPVATESAAEEAPKVFDRAIVLTSEGEVIAIDLTADATLSTTTIWAESDPVVSLSAMARWVGVVTESGRVVRMRPSTGQAVELWTPSDELPPAVDVARRGSEIGIVTSDGALLTAPWTDPATVDDVETVWDPADAEGVRATSVLAIGDLMPFVLDNGDVPMLLDSGGLGVAWEAGEQPAAFNAAADDTGILLGVGQGMIAKYQLGDFTGDRLISVWDPSTTGEVPAIGYAPINENTAVVTQTGDVLLVDDTGTGPKVWDAALTEVPAVSVATRGNTLLVLLNSGTVIRIRTAQNEVSSIWDTNDETLAAAVQVVLISPN